MIRGIHYFSTELKTKIDVIPRGCFNHFSAQWLKQVSATELPRTKSWDISLDCYIGKYRGVIRSKIVFLESVTFQFHARMLSSEVAQSLKRYGHFSDLGIETALSHRHVGFFG